MGEVDLATFAAVHRVDATVIDVREPFDYVIGDVPATRSSGGHATA